MQDTLITVLSEKTLPVPELGSEVQAVQGFSVIATANNRDKGVNELSSALKRRFNTVILPVPASQDEEVQMIGDMPLALQSRLLRVLQEREVLRVGSTTPVPVDLRVIAATHADLAALVERGEFRRDLFYRLAVLRLSMPGLHERGQGDVQALARAMLARRLHTQSLQAEGPSLESLLAALLELASGHRWPGNARELDNWVERLLACRHDLRDSAGRVDMGRLRELFPECDGAGQGAIQALPAQQRQLQLREARRDAERQRMREVLEQVQGDQRRACEIDPASWPSAGRWLPSSRVIWTARYPELLPHLLRCILQVSRIEPFIGLLNQMLAEQPDYLRQISRTTRSCTSRPWTTRSSVNAGSRSCAARKARRRTPMWPAICWSCA